MLGKRPETPIIDGIYTFMAQEIAPQPPKSNISCREGPEGSARVDSGVSGPSLQNTCGERRFWTFPSRDTPEMVK